MEIANLVLKYVEALKWPIIIAFSLVYFRPAIDSLLEKLVELNVGGEKGFKLRMQAAQKIAEKAASDAHENIETHKESSLVLSLPDESFIYLNSLAKKPIKDKYFPASAKELKNLCSLSDYGVMRQKSISEFELTEIGKSLASDLEKL